MLAVNIFIPDFFASASASGTICLSSALLSPLPPLHLDVEGQDHRQVGSSFEHCTREPMRSNEQTTKSTADRLSKGQAGPLPGSYDIFLMHGTDIDGGDRNARVVQKVQESLKRSQRRCLAK
eukprot:756940-Hanusia_phi.AAC.2